MKQHITKEQFLEVSNIWYVDVEKEYTIGKMIEILRENVVTMNISNDYDIELEEPYEWWIIEYNYGEKNCKKQSAELIDALWEVVKAIMNE